MTGVDEVAPKKGVTAHQLLKEVGKNPLISLSEAKKEIETIGWSYLDLSVFFPDLHIQKLMREKMVKRPFLATFEKMVPVLEAEANYCFTAYTHKAYRKQVVELLLECTGFSKIANSKGVEATTRPKLNLPTEVIWSELNGIQEKSISLNGKDCKTVFSNADMMSKGVEVLKGVQNEAYDVIVSHAALSLHLFKGVELEIAYINVKEVIENGLAFNLWNDKS